MKKYTAWVLMLFFSFSFEAFSAMRCGRNLINLGDYKNDVIDLCGEPETIEKRTKVIGSTLHHPRRTLDIQQFEEIQVEEWVYNFGPHRLQQYLRFENGELKEIKSLRRGH